MFIRHALPGAENTYKPQISNERNILRKVTRAVNCIWLPLVIVLTMNAPLTVTTQHAFHHSPVPVISSPSQITGFEVRGMFMVKELFVGTLDRATYCTWNVLPHIFCTHDRRHIPHNNIHLYQVHAHVRTSY